MHNPAKGDFLKKIGADEVVKFDLTDKGTWGPALAGVEAIYSASLDPLLEHHINFSKHLGSLQGQVKHVVRVSCMGADTNTASYDPDKHVSRDGAAIPIMLQHYWWGEKALVDSGAPGVAQLFARASEVLGYDLLQLCVEGPMSQLALTRRAAAQPRSP